MLEERILRKLKIRAFHINDVVFGEKTLIEKGTLTLNKANIPALVGKDSLVEKINIEIIKPGDHNREINTIMDIVPISAKVLGNLGEGVTHTLTGVYVMLTGADEDGKQMAEFGSSEGNMREKLFLNRPGTPSDSDIIIHIDVTLKGGQIYDRKLPTAAFKASDEMIHEVREVLKKIDGREADESHEFLDRERPGKKKVVILKQIAGQGAMYDNQLFSNEPSGFSGGRSIIDMGNVPMIISPNEYRDGALRSMT